MIGKKTLTFALAMLFVAGSQTQAVLQDKIFTSSGQILPGEEWKTVYIYNDGTIVNMTGGIVNEIACFDASALNMSGGEIDLLSSIEQSTVNISGGSIGSIKVYDNSFANLSQNATIFEIQVHDTATFDMNGGTIDYLGALYSSILNLHGGDITKALISSSFATINVFGKNLAKTDTGGTYGFGQVTGLWQNDLPITINLDGSDTYSRINLIPEPTTFLLLGVGAFLLRRTRY